MKTTEVKLADRILDQLESEAPRLKELATKNWYILYGEELPQ